MKLKLIFPLLLFSFSALGDPIATERIQIKENRTLNEKVSNQKAELDQLKLSKMALEEQLKVASFQLEEIHTMHDDFLNRMNFWVALSAIAVSILSILGFLFGIRDRRAIKKDSDEFVNQQKEYLQKEVVELENLILDKFAEKEELVKSTLRKLVDSEAHSDNLKINSELLVLEPYNNRSQLTHEILRMFNAHESENIIGFNSLDTNPSTFEEFINREEIQRIKQADALIIIDEEGEFLNAHEALFLDIAKKVVDTKTALFWPGQGHIKFEKINSEFVHLISTSNRPAQFYGNLLNLLKYRDELLNEQGS